MDKVRKSLEDNLDEILKNLPEEFHDGCRKEIAEACESCCMSDEEEKAAILDALPAEHAEGFLANPTAHKPLPKPSIEEQKAAVLAALDNEEHKKQFSENCESQLCC